MPHLFVYGSLKQGFVNQHVNTGRRVPGQFRTSDKFGLYLLGKGEVPCLVSPPGHGHQVVGELYEITDADIQRMDRLERTGDPDGYERVEIGVERFDPPATEIFTAFVYLRQHCNIPAATPRIGPLDEYRLEHAARFSWQGAN
ncbi:gamma-glutamylcyclotransferase family protein [Azohydromonas aeria]|uniref:gamma-glutamylcyclotransferase family protein n=1 Tax=Azohydromonas aeria TaxID=2590212 RepID=UPI0012F8B927|nr:gamma-glutamylcyclotransferase family protein [Azohydromonas aeria]